MRKMLVPVALVAVAMMAAPHVASACGGFFCGRQPVDQTAERIVFGMNQDGTVTMIVQIAFAGAAPDFAWILPLGSVPDPDSLDTFPQRALTALDANTGPQFQWPDGCALWEADGAGPPSAGGGMTPDPGGVTVHIREAVGPFDVAVIESTDPAALVSWLRDNGFRVTTPEEPYIRAYTAEGMKFLALRLQPGRDVNEIEPFMFTLPGEAASIPLRMTALAAEPEMGIAVFILGDMRFGGANWPDLAINDDDIVWDPFGSYYPAQNNWTALVARAADEAGGFGWATEFAGSTESFRTLVENTMPPPDDMEQIRAREALLPLLSQHSYMTRLYTRLSPEEMTVDPIFHRVPGGDVSNVHHLPRYVDGRDLCGMPPWAPGGGGEDATTPCDFTTCGAGGLCRVVAGDGTTTRDSAGCACIPGMTARTTFDPSGSATVICQDMRLSFLNPGDRETPDADPLPDPCVGFDCGPGGECVAMNMTPTCRCDIGLVATGSIDATTGARSTSCVSPSEPVPIAFYTRPLARLPEGLPGGRRVDVPTVNPVASGGGGCAVAAHEGAPAPAWMALGLVAAAMLLAGRRRRS